MHRRAPSPALRIALLSGLLLLPAARGAEYPCLPGAGLRVDAPLSLLGAVRGEPALVPEAELPVAWEEDLGGAASPAVAQVVAAAGLSPWVSLVFRTPAPLLDHLTELQHELAASAEIARQGSGRERFQLLWRPPGEEEPDPAEYAFLLKRASVALTGARPGAWVVTAPLPARSDWLRAFYAEEVAGYLEVIALAPDDDAALAAAIALLAELDPGRTLVLDGPPLGAEPATALLEAARQASRGFHLVLFRTPEATPERLAPLRVLANESHGDLSPDPHSAPAGAPGWAFVRGEDLGLRVVVANPEGRDELALAFPDPQLREPVRIDLATGESRPVAALQVAPDGLRFRVPDPGPAVLLRLSRLTAAELEGIDEEVTVASERTPPVAEILRRLQAAEDDQARRLRHFQALNATTLRFQAPSGAGSIDATFEGEYFSREGGSTDWAWQTLYINGVRWRAKTLPEIPIVQPERAAAMPLEIRFTQEYRYRLRGTDRVAGRDCWVVDFEPAAAVEAGYTLYRGTVWIDRETHHRVRSRALQLGLTGEVIGNEETLDYTPLDATGEPTAWTREAFYLPLRARAQQILSVLNTAIVVERESVLSAVVLNGPDFDARREALLASETTMVRETEQGLRYLEEDPEQPGQRRVRDGFDTSKLFAAGGLFWDGALDYPVPLAGVNYFDLDFRGGGRQLNALFGGVLGSVAYADPRLFGSDFDLGANFFGIAIPLGDTVYRDGKEVPDEEVRALPARLSFHLGYPLGGYGKLRATYALGYFNFQRADDTAPGFRLPSDHFVHTYGLDLQLSRSGYRLRLAGNQHRRSRWEPWGPAENPDYDARDRTYETWSAAASKNWYFSKFRKLGAEVEYLGGSRLDRFSKYGFGIFGDSRVHGYQIGKIRAEEAVATHLSYGFEIGQLLRLDAVGDVAWATDRASGLHRETLAGVGVAGTFIGPWETIVNLDVGVPVAGPDSGLTVYIVFLKLFH